MILNMEEQKRKLLLQHVHQFIATTENQEVTMQDIAEYCGVAKGTLYNYFPSKEDLLLAVFEDVMGPFDREVEDLLGKRTLEPERKLREMIRIHLRFFVENRNLMRMYAREVNKVFSVMSETKTPREAFFVNHTLWFLDLCSSLMNDLFPDADVRMIAHMYHEMLKGYLMYFLFSNQEIDLNTHTEYLYTFFMNGATGYAGIQPAGENR